MRELFPEDPRDLPPDRWARMGLSEVEYREMRAGKMAREEQAPEVGAIAPDIKAERLSQDRTRTGEMYRLSQSRGEPVALIFGSYT